MKLAAVIVALLLLSSGALAGARVIDGDTLDVDGQRVRLWGIDAPESRQRCEREAVTWLCGQEAAKALRERLLGRTVACQQKDRDRYGRSVALCRVDGQDVAEWLAREGWALDYRQFSKGAYAAAEAEARQAGRGLWAGTFVTPWEYRRRP